MKLVDDALDYESGEAKLGKPGGADLQLGLATGPALYAWEEHPEMGALIARKFKREGDVELVCGIVIYWLRPLTDKGRVFRLEVSSDDRLG
jgi:hexaprenyl-diphosphate synthase